MAAEKAAQLVDCTFKAGLSFAMGPHGESLMPHPGQREELEALRRLNHGLQVEAVGMYFAMARAHQFDCAHEFCKQVHDCVTQVLAVRGVYDQQTLLQKLARNAESLKIHIPAVGPVGTLHGMTLPERDSPNELEDLRTLVALLRNKKAQFFLAVSVEYTNARSNAFCASFVPRYVATLAALEKVKVKLVSTAHARALAGPGGVSKKRPAPSNSRYGTRSKSQQFAAPPASRLDAFK